MNKPEATDVDVLVVGANGLVGSNVVDAALARDLQVAGTYHSTAPAFDAPVERLDVRDADRMRSLFETHEPDAVVNCAAATDVDWCEANPEAALAINGAAAGEMARLCGRFGCRFVQLSTDYVFDGTDAPYTEDDEPEAVQAYGRSKLAGERAVRAAPVETNVVRLSFVYGVHGATGELTGFPAWVRDRLAAGEETPLFVDQRVTPTRAGHAAETILDVLDAGRTGTAHVAARSCVTPHEFGELIRAEVDAPAALLTEGSMNDVDRAAARPANTCLSVDRIERWLDRPQPTLMEDISAIASSLE